MKKLIFFITCIIFISQKTISDEIKSCDELKKMSADYIKCKASGLKSINEKVGLDTENIKEKKYIIDWFKKKQ